MDNYSQLSHWCLMHKTTPEGRLKSSHNQVYIEKISQLRQRDSLWVNKQFETKKFQFENEMTHAVIGMIKEMQSDYVVE